MIYGLSDAQQLRRLFLLRGAAPQVRRRLAISYLQKTTQLLRGGPIFGPVKFSNSLLIT